MKIKKRIIITIFIIVFLTPPFVCSFGFGDTKTNTKTLYLDVPDGFETKHSENRVWYEKKGDRILHY